MATKHRPIINPEWLTAEQVSMYVGGMNAKYVRQLWAKGLMRFSKPDVGQAMTKKEWVDEYLENCEVMASDELNKKLDLIIKDLS